MVGAQMGSTKIGFNHDQLQEIYKGKEIEKVWLDFGKVNSNVIRYDPKCQE
jgi:hypothetical protein